MITSRLVPASEYPEIGMLQPVVHLDEPVRIFQRVFAELKPLTGVLEVRVEFCRFANANSLIRLEEGRLHVRITDVLEGAPSAILEALANILLSKFHRRAVPRQFADRYHRYLNRHDMRGKLDLIRQTRGRKLASPPKGDLFDLDKLFDELNFRYF